MADAFSIENRRIGGGSSPFIIAEVAQAHDGSLGTAHAYIDAVAELGVDAVKFQTHIAAEESTPGEPWRVHFSRQDAHRYDYWRRMEFSREQWAGLREHACEKGLIFLSSPFSEAAVELLVRIGTSAFKVGSGEVSNQPLLDRLSATGRPVLLSSGMAPWADLDRAMASLPGPKAVFQCTSKYPCPPEDLGLNLIEALRQRYQVPVGLSDHSATVFAGLGAVTLGADLLEVHVVFDRRCFGPDSGSSLTLSELGQLVEGARYLHAAQTAPVDKDAMADALAPMRALFEKSVVLKRPKSAGEVLERSDFAFKKPGTGIPARSHGLVVGRVLARAVPADRPLTEEDLV